MTEFPATIIFLKRGQLQIEKALQNLKWNTAKFESELAIFANTQTSRVQYRLWRQYVEWMQQCGVPLELVEVVEPKQEKEAKE